METLDKRTVWDFVKKLASRKLLVFIVATVLLIVNKINQDTWLWVGVIYMGINAASAAIQGYKDIKAKVASKTSALTEEKEEEKEGSA